MSSSVGANLFPSPACVAFTYGWCATAAQPPPPVLLPLLPLATTAGARAHHWAPTPTLVSATAPTSAPPPSGWAYLLRLKAAVQ
jgi:hypothetical protein